MIANIFVETTPPPAPDNSSATVVSFPEWALRKGGKATMLR